MRFILKKKTLIFHKVGIIWSIIEFFLVILKRRILKTENILVVILQSILRGYSEGGVFTSIAFHKTIISGICLTLSSLISSLVSNYKNHTSSRNVGFKQIIITFLLNVFYLFKQNKTYPIQCTSLMIIMGLFWNLIGHFTKTRNATFLRNSHFVSSFIAYLYDSVFEIGFLYAALAEINI